MVENKKSYRENGTVYTPDILAEYVAQKTIQYFFKDHKGGVKKSNNLKISVIDPACGEGILLEAAWKELNKGNRKIKKTIHGIDIDKKAIIICKNNLSKTFGNDLNSDFKMINTNALSPLNEKSLFDGWNKIKKKFNIKDGFDILITNPPWGADISKYRNKLHNNDFKTLNGQFDSYELFVELALEIVKPGGYFSFIIPDSLLNHEKTLLRSILLKKTQIKFISRLGEKIFPKINRSCVVLICKNEVPHSSSKTDCFRLNKSQRKMILEGNLKFYDAEETSIHKIRQRRFLLNKDYLFDIDLKESETEILEKIRNTKNILGDYLVSSRGIELSGSGKICQCPICNLWMPYPKSTKKQCIHCNSTFELKESTVKHIVKDEKIKNGVNLINGYNIKRYQCKPSRWLETGIKGIHYKDVNLYKGEKLLVRKTGVGISASIDYNDFYTTQVVFIFKLKEKVDPDITLEFILSLINSRAYYFYITKSFGENEWRSHPYLTQQRILDLPFHIIKNNEQKKIVREVTKLLKPYLKNNLELPTHIDSKIEYLISVLYKLTRKDYKVIYETINNSEELLPIKALKKIQINEIFNKNRRV